MVCFLQHVSLLIHCMFIRSVISFLAFFLLWIPQEGSLPVEQRTNGKGKPFFPLEANTLSTHVLVGTEKDDSGMVLGGNPGFGEMRASCEASMLRSESLIAAAAVSSKAPDQTEMMSQGGSMPPLGVWASLRYASSPGSAVLQEAPGIDWLAELESINLYVALQLFQFLVEEAFQLLFVYI